MSFTHCDYIVISTSNINAFPQLYTHSLQAYPQS